MQVSNIKVIALLVTHLVNMEKRFQILNVQCNAERTRKEDCVVELGETVSLTSAKLVRKIKTMILPKMM